MGMILYKCHTYVCILKLLKVEKVIHLRIVETELDKYTLSTIINPTLVAQFLHSEIYQTLPCIIIST